jgi:adenylate cyclase
MRTTRRLAAILAADVAGYSRLMGADEEGTHERLQTHLRELVNPKIEQHRGRIVKNTGDGFLAEFQSVVDAVRCAVEVQRGTVKREPEVPKERRIRFRIGVNLGDVIVEEHDIFGDGVNVAARLEGLAEPGGICISRVVRDQIRDKLPYPFEDRGEHSVKNITRPVRVYALRPEPVAELPARSIPVPAIRRQDAAPWGLIAAVVAIFVIALVVWRVWLVASSSSTPVASVVDSARPAPPATQPSIAPRLSIVVLPFANLSDDPGQQYFADGITEDLTTDLSRIPHSFVISSNTAFTYRNRPANAKQIGHELGVRYVLEGSVRRSSNQVRVNAQLIDAQTDAHLWAERFDRDIGDMFALQTDITHRIAFALNVELVIAEAARPTQSADALDYIFRGRAAMSRAGTPDTYAEAIRNYERALALDSQSVEAQSLLASALVSRVLNFATSSSEGDIKRAEELATGAVTASPWSALAHFARGNVLRAQRRCREAIPEYETVIALNRNWAEAFADIGRCKIYVGPLEDAIPAQEQAIRLSPRGPALGVWYFRIGLVHLLQSRIDEAIVWLERARRARAGLWFVHAHLAAVYALKGETGRATAELAEARRLWGEGQPWSIAQMRATSRYEVPALQALWDATFITGLRKAGMPEE